MKFLWYFLGSMLTNRWCGGESNKSQTGDQNKLQFVYEKPLNSLSCDRSGLDVGSQELLLL